MATIRPVVEQSIARFLADVQRQRRVVTVYLYGSQIWLGLRLERH